MTFLLQNATIFDGAPITDESLGSDLGLVSAWRKTCASSPLSAAKPLDWVSMHIHKVPGHLDKMTTSSATLTRITKQFWAALRKLGIDPVSVLRHARLPLILMEDEES